MSLINLGYSGAQAARIGLNVTALNIANVATPGFSRQRSEQQAIAGQYGQRLSSGGGVEVSSIRRIADRFHTTQLWRATTDVSYYDCSQGYLSALETLMGGESGSLGDGLDNLFSALSGSSDKPENPAMRQNILTEAKSLAQRFNNVAKFLQNQQRDSHSQQQERVTQINTVAANIADYNKKIREIAVNGGDTSVLCDQRDELVNNLSTLVSIRSSENDNGEYTLTMPDGQPLVSGSDSSHLEIKPDASGEPQLWVNFAGSRYATGMSCGGQLGALHDYQQQTLKPMNDALQGMAEVLSTAFNQQLAQGFDLQGNPGKPLFRFNADDPQGMLQVSDLQWDALALSGKAGEKGDNHNLLALLAIKDKSFAITGIGNSSLSNASALLVNTIGTRSRQNQTEQSSAQALSEAAQSQRDSFSQVNVDEEYVSLTTYTQAYHASMKVIATGDELFSGLLALF